jgi:hypothetical protein
VRRLRAGLFAIVVAGSACSGDLPAPTLDDLRQPTGFRLEPEGRWAYVSNGNWDRGETGGSILALDMRGLDRALATTPADGDPTRAAPCRPEGTRLRCSAAHMIVPGSGRGIGSAVGNIVIDRPSGQAGPTRLITVQRAPSAIVWFGVTIADDGPELDCGTAFDGSCDAVHVIDAALERAEVVLPDDPSRVVLDEQGFRFGYVPHLLGGAISLLLLDGEMGPELVDVQDDFYEPDPFEETEYAGGFSVASRPCDLANPPSGSLECTRPVLYTSQRFDPSVRRFAVDPGRDLIAPGDRSSLAIVNPESVASTPFMADLAFEDPTDGVDLLVVQTSPPALLRVDTTVEEDGESGDHVIGTLPLCEQPNMLAVHRPEGGEALALVTCFADGALAVVGLSSFRVIQIVELGAGANEVQIDPVTQRAYVVNTRDDSISVVALDRTNAAFLTEIARIE